MVNNFDGADGRPKITTDALLDRLRAVKQQQEAGRARAAAKVDPWAHTSGSGPVIVDPHKG